MKNTIINLTLTLIFIAISISAQELTTIGDKQGNLILNVTGFENNDGKVMIALFNSEDGYSETGLSYKSIALEIEDLKTEWIIESLSFGEYAIKLYHDENSNNKMDRNMLGIPSEDYAFSNNATGNFGPADYEDAKFIFDKSVQIHKINID